MLAAIEARGLRWGIDQQARALTTPVVAALNLAQRAAVVVSAIDAAFQAGIRRRCCHAALAMKVLPGGLRHVGDDLRDIEAARPPEWRPSSRRYGYMGQAGDPAAWPATGHIAAPLECSPGCAERLGRTASRVHSSHSRARVACAGNAHRLLLGERLQHRAHDVVRTASATPFACSRRSPFFIEAAS